MNQKNNTINSIISYIKIELNPIKELSNANNLLVEIWEDKKIESFRFLNETNTINKCINQIEKLLNALNIDDLEDILKTIKTKSIISFIKRPWDNMIEFKLSINSKELSIFIYNEENKIKELNNFADTYNLDSAELEELNQIFKEVEPPYKKISSVLSILKENTLQLFSTNEIKEFVFNREYSFSELTTNDLSDEILDLINTSFSNILKKRLSVKKVDNGYEILLFGKRIQKICYEIKLYFEDHLAI